MAQPFNLFWTESKIQIYAGAICMVQTFDDTKIEYIDSYITGYYYQYTKDPNGACVASKQQNYYSGQNLLVDYNNICGYSVYLQNLGFDSS